VCTDRDSAVRLATSTALSEINIDVYDPRSRFQYDDTSGAFDDEWFKYTGTCECWIETWNPDEQKNEPKENTSIHVDSAIKKWIVECASTADDALNTLDAWKHGERVDVITPFIDAVEKDVWYDSRTSNPLGSASQFEWEKRFGKKGGLELNLDTNCCVDENDGVRLVVFFDSKGEQSTYSREMDIDIIPGLAMSVAYDDAERIQAITLRYTSLDAAKLAKGVVQNEHPLHWEYEEDEDVLKVYFSEGATSSFGGVERASTSLPGVSAVFGVVHKFVPPYTTTKTLREICINAPTHRLACQNGKV
jgi:hypothetical protein